jgi:hypothetical protein
MTLYQKQKFMNILDNKFIKKYWIIFVVGIILQTVYLVFSIATYKTGFPLDDSWIHQTYAKNLVLFKDWYFVPGIRSAGSTSPLWTIILTPGHFFRNNFYYFWTFLVSGLLLIISSILFQCLFERISRKKMNIPWVGILLLLEWHIIWATNSGMETILYIFFIILIFFLLFKKNINKYMLISILVGLIIFIRPDGITLLGPLLFANFFRSDKSKNGLFKEFLLILVTILAFFCVYAFFNHALSGEFFPNTFYAKQAEYEILYKTSIISRFLGLLLIPLTGFGVLMLPGFLFYLYQMIKTRNWMIISIYLWFLGYIMIYAIRLPVTYQHGRYIIPTIPIYLLLSILGLFEIKNRFIALKELIIFGYKAAILFVAIAFLFLGGRAYAQDVAIIESEMVKTAIWIEENLEEDTIIAAHDIGALGFFSERKILDLAGLISPDVIPFIRDEGRLANYLDENEANYLVVFPNWYDDLAVTKEEIYSTNSIFSPEAGGENLRIYIWK